MQLFRKAGVNIGAWYVSSFDESDTLVTKTDLKQFTDFNYLVVRKSKA